MIRELLDKLIYLVFANSALVKGLTFRIDNLNAQLVDADRQLAALQKRWKDETTIAMDMSVSSKMDNYVILVGRRGQWSFHCTNIIVA